MEVIIFNQVSFTAHISHLNFISNTEDFQCLEDHPDQLERPDEDEDSPESVATLSQLSCPTQASVVTPKPQKGDSIRQRLCNQKSDWLETQTPPKESKPERSKVLLSLAEEIKNAMEAKKNDKSCSATLPAHAPWLFLMILHDVFVYWVILEQSRFNILSHIKKSLGQEANDPEGLAPTKPKKKKKSTKRPAQLKDAANSQKSDSQPAGTEPQTVGEQYEPQKYSKVRKEFLHDLKSKGVASSRDREDSWNKSSVKRNLLATIPLQELKRRRFVSKECKVHPYV